MEFTIARVSRFNVAYFLFAAELRRVEHFDQRKPGETTHDARTPARALAGRRQLVVKQGKQNETISLIFYVCVCRISPSQHAVGGKIKIA